MNKIILALFFMCICATAQAQEVSGNRLKLIIYESSDGSRTIDPFLRYDSKLNIKCTIGAKDYCRPYNISHIHEDLMIHNIYSDSNCKNKIKIFNSFKSNEKFDYFQTNDRNYYKNPKFINKPLFIIETVQNKQTNYEERSICEKFIPDQNYNYYSSLGEKVDMNVFVSVKEIIVQSKQSEPNLNIACNQICINQKYASGDYFENNCRCYPTMN